MSLFSPLLVVCLDREEAHAVSELARSLGYPDAHVVEGGFASAIEALNLRTTSPDYIIVDIGGHHADIIPDLDQLALHCEPNVRVVVIGGVNDIVFYRELKQRGVVEYFTRPASAADVRAVLMQRQNSLTTISGSGVASQGHVISFMSAASGDGASTLATNFAYCLAEEFKLPTVLIDMDYQFGLVAKSLDLTAPFGIRELFDHPERGLDQMLVNKMLVNYGSHLRIIASPGELKLLPLIHPEIIRELIAILRSQFAFVVIDVPHVWTDWTAAALSYSNHVTMVAQLWLRSLTHASRLLSAWNSIGIVREDISLVINRSGAKFKEAITAQDFERICRHQIAAYVNNDVKAITYAENHAKTLFESGQSAQLTEQIRALAQRMVTRYRGQEWQEPAAAGSKKSWLGLLGKSS